MVESVLPSQLPRKEVPSHGRGMLYRGGVPGHDGSNAGRKKDRIRQALENGLDSKGVKKLLAFLDAENLTAAECARIFEVAAKYSIGEADPNLEPDEALLRFNRGCAKWFANQDRSEEYLLMLEFVQTQYSDPSDPAEPVEHIEEAK